MQQSTVLLKMYINVCGSLCVDKGMIAKASIHMQARPLQTKN